MAHNRKRNNVAWFYGNGNIRGHCSVCKFLFNPTIYKVRPPCTFWRFVVKVSRQLLIYFYLLLCSTKCLGQVSHSAGGQGSYRRLQTKYVRLRVDKVIEYQYRIIFMNKIWAFNVTNPDNVVKFHGTVVYLLR